MKDAAAAVAADAAGVRELCAQREWHQARTTRWPGLPHAPFEDRRQRSFNLQLERLVHEIVRLLLKAQVCFWLDQGTLLSVWRHGSPVLRYDTDADLGILLDDVDIGLAALTKSSKLGVKDWREKEDLQDVGGSQHVEVFWRTSPTARCDLYIYLYKQEEKLLAPMERFLAPSPRQYLLPLQLFRWRGLVLPCAAEPDRWLTTTEPDIYREWDIGIPSKQFDWASLRYVTQESCEDSARDCSSSSRSSSSSSSSSSSQEQASRADLHLHFDVVLLVWLPDSRLLSQTAQSLRQQDALNEVWDIRVLGASSSLERQLLSRLPRPSPTVRSWQQLRSNAQELDRDIARRCDGLQRAPAERPRVVCLWDSHGNYSWRRLTVQLAPLLRAGSPARATRLPGLDSREVTQCVRVNNLDSDQSNKNSGDNDDDDCNSEGGHDVALDKSREGHGVGLELRRSFATKAEHPAALDSSWVDAAAWNGCIPVMSSQTAWQTEP